MTKRTITKENFFINNKKTVSSLMQEIINNVNNFKGDLTSLSADDHQYNSYTVYEFPLIIGDDLHCMGNETFQINIALANNNKYYVYLEKSIFVSCLQDNCSHEEVVSGELDLREAVIFSLDIYNNFDKDSGQYSQAS